MHPTFSDLVDQFAEGLWPTMPAVSLLKDRDALVIRKTRDRYRGIIMAVYNHYGTNQSQVADTFGLSRTTVYNILKQPYIAEPLAKFIAEFEKALTKAWATK